MRGIYSLLVILALGLSVFAFFYFSKTDSLQVIYENTTNINIQLDKTEFLNVLQQSGVISEQGVFDSDKVQYYRPETIKIGINAIDDNSNKKYVDRIIVGDKLVFAYTSAVVGSSYELLIYLDTTHLAPLTAKQATQEVNAMALKAIYTIAEISNKKTQLVASDRENILTRLKTNTSKVLLHVKK